MSKKVFEPTLKLMTKFIFGLSFKNLARMLKVRIFDAEMTDFFTNTIKENVQYRLENKIERNDFMDLMLKMHINDGKLTLKEMTANSFLFFLAGFETSSINPDIQEKLRDEIKSIVDENDGKITYEGMMKMKYLQMVIDGNLIP